MMPSGQAMGQKHDSGMPTPEGDIIMTVIASNIDKYCHFVL